MQNKYNMLSSSLYVGCNYNSDIYTSSAWEYWPNLEPSSRFHLCLIITDNDLDHTGVGTEDYAYTWKTYYKNAASDDDYMYVTGSPWSCVPLREGEDVIYRCPLMDYGMEKPNVGDTYHMIFFIYDEEGALVGWCDQLVDWTDSSEAFYDVAMDYGIID